MKKLLSYISLIFYFVSFSIVHGCTEGKLGKSKSYDGASCHKKKSKKHNQYAGSEGDLNVNGNFNYVYDAIEDGLNDIQLQIDNLQKKGNNLEGYLMNLLGAILELKEEKKKYLKKSKGRSDCIEKVLIRTSSMDEEIKKLQDMILNNKNVLNQQGEKQEVIVQKKEISPISQKQSFFNRSAFLPTGTLLACIVYWNYKEGDQSKSTKDKKGLKKKLNENKETPSQLTRNS